MKIRHPEALAPAAANLLPRLAALSWAEDFYLAGSAALALYLGHRPVRDLDFMSPAHRLRAAERRDLLQELLACEAAVIVETARDGFLHLRFPGDVALKLFYYPYPLVGPQREHDGWRVAAAEDLGLMKLGAIISRGTRRDLLDLYLLCRQLPLARLLELSPGKFRHVGDFPLQALKGLAELPGMEPLPRLSAPVDWAEVESWACAEVAALGRVLVEGT
jgi:hypothetical protein